MRQHLWLIVYFLLVGGSVSRAQSFRFDADVPAVKQPGYYRILLPPTLVGALNANLTDIRLYDANQREVPYLLTHQLPKSQKQLSPLPVIRRLSTPRGSTTLVVRNAAKSRINALGMTIKNTSVTKLAQLSGSNDNQTWYAIGDNYQLEPAQSSTTTSEVKVLDFPLSDYEYYKLDINDSLTAPLNILNVGSFTRTEADGTYTEIPGLRVSQRDSGAIKKSFVHLLLPDTVRIDKLGLMVQSAGPYRRSAEIVLRRRRIIRGRVENYPETVRTFELNSAGDQTVYLPGVRAKDLYVIVDNQDNPPLTISGAKAWQAHVYLIARLAPGAAYRLRFGNPGLQAPVYDLVYFKDSIPVSLPVITVREINPAKESGKVADGSFFMQPWVLWPALGLVVLLLGLLSYRMLTEMSSGK